MNEEIYKVAAFAMRYWFLLLIIVVLLRSLRWLRHDARRSAKTLSRLPDAGSVGEWAVLSCESGRLAEGDTLPLPQEGRIGRSRLCDVRVKDPSVPRQAARFCLLRDGVHLYPQARNEITADGEPVRREALLCHGSVLELGGVTLQLRLFAGIRLLGEEELPLPQGAELPVRKTEEKLVLPSPSLTLRLSRGRVSALRGAHRMKRLTMQEENRPIETHR